jgi:hypothetical protein
VSRLAAGAADGAKPADDSKPGEGGSAAESESRPLSATVFDGDIASLSLSGELGPKSEEGRSPELAGGPDDGPFRRVGPKNFVAANQADNF